MRKKIAPLTARFLFSRSLGPMLSGCYLTRHAFVFCFKHKYLSKVSIVTLSAFSAKCVEIRVDLANSHCSSQTHQHHSEFLDLSSHQAERSAR